MNEQAHIKDVISRIVVEIAKREWPQQWEQMTVELSQIYSQGVNCILNLCRFMFLGYIPLVFIVLLILLSILL